MDGVALGHFNLLEKIGEGGMGEVYKARDTQLGRLVAIKVLPEARCTDADRRTRFVQEAQAASALNHPNIITIHEIDEQEERIFIVMELVDGKPLSELIPRKGMPVTEVLRIAAQVAGALVAAHAAGVVHRDLKPANIMVDGQGRVKVLDFGLAKLSAPSAAPLGGEDQTRTLAAAQPVTAEGVIVGSIPYMCPEQIQGKPVDGRGDIFSFGAVLYEMITGQRAFRGESRVSTLAAILEKEPPPPREIAFSIPPELERLIVRCLRKDVNRRSQTMADVKLALEEFLGESESGRLAGPVGPAPAGGRRLWPAISIGAMLIAAAAVVWIYFDFRGTPSAVPSLVRVSPDDGHSYAQPAISPDGGFVAYVSDRTGKDELWLQQVGGGEPIQLTHSHESVSSPSFFPDGKRIVYVTTSDDARKSAIEVISALGGDPRVLFRGERILKIGPMLSPDGRHIAYFELQSQGVRLMTISPNGGSPQELPNWAGLHQGIYSAAAAWTSDSRYLLNTTMKRSKTTGVDELEWFAFPVDGGSPVNTEASDVLRAAGLEQAVPALITGDHVLFRALSKGRANVWEIRLSPSSRHVQGVPHQVTFGTENEFPFSVSAAGDVALDVGIDFANLYLIALSSITGQPTSVARRLTKDRRLKVLTAIGGNPDSVYFGAMEGDRLSFYALDLDSGKQAPVGTGLPFSTLLAISYDGRKVAYSIPEGDSYSILVGETGASAQEARVICKACGAVRGFSPDGRFLFYQPEVGVKPDPKSKLSVRLLDLASGKNKPWLEHPVDSVYLGNAVGQDSEWVVVSLVPLGSRRAGRIYLVPWTEEPVPTSKWVETSMPFEWRGDSGSDFFYGFVNSRLMVTHLDPRGGVGEYHEVRFMPNSSVTLKPDDNLQIRGPRLVFSHVEATDSVWLMKTPR